MKTITFQGTDEQIDLAFQPLSLLPAKQAVFMKTALKSNLNALLKEIRVYSVDCNGTENEGIKFLADEDFMKLAEEQGTVFTLEGFQYAINNSELYIDESYIRFISVPLL